MNCEVNDDFFDDFYDDLNKCCIKPASGGISYLIKKSFQHNNPNSQCERSMDCAADNDNFYDEYYDDVDNFSNPFEGKENSLFNKNGKDLLSLKRTDPIFIPFNSKHRGVQEILKDVHVQPKRINEIIDVFNNLMKEEMSKKPKVVLLTGPPGCGKTFLMEKIFKLFEFRVKRYDEKQTLLNPNDSSLGKINYSGLFINFLYSCNYMAHRCYTSYGAINNKCTMKLIVILFFFIF